MFRLGTLNSNIRVTFVGYSCSVRTWGRCNINFPFLIVKFLSRNLKNFLVHFKKNWFGLTFFTFMNAEFEYALRSSGTLVVWERRAGTTSTLLIYVSTIFSIFNRENSSCRYFKNFLVNFKWVWVEYSRIRTLSNFSFYFLKKQFLKIFG